MSLRPRAVCASVAALILASTVLAITASAQSAGSRSENRAASPERGGIVFTGSSIFRYWTHLTDQMAPLPVLNRAIAGTVTYDMLSRIGRLVLPYQPRIVVYYCGSNDVGAGEEAGPIVERTKQFIQILHEKLPETFFYYTSILKAPDKSERWDVVDAVNREMERYSHEATNVGYIDLNLVLFDSRNNLRENLFLPDELHFRPDSTAYPEFSQIVKPILTKAWEDGVGLPKRN
ncbi:MAG TPA: GDSL-type esterase/lipase family protein [Bryobacteraceae bacterium]|jgi:lysophospholipase L1-like esterase